MNTVTLQVPMDKNLREQATLAAYDNGFSSLQDAIRFLLNKFAKRQLSISVTGEKVVRLSKKNEKRYMKMEADFRANRNVYHAKDVDDLFRQLNS